MYSRVLHSNKARVLVAAHSLPQGLAETRILLLHGSLVVHSSIVSMEPIDFRKICKYSRDLNSSIGTFINFWKFFQTSKKLK